MLLTQPETGMGYQLVEFRADTLSGLVQGIAFNAEIVVDLDGEFDPSRRLLARQGFGYVAARADMTRSMAAVRDLKVVAHHGRARTSMVAEPRAAKCGRIPGPVAALDAREENANGQETFVRLSAYWNDRRVDQVRKRLIPGTFSTMLRDYRLCVECPDEPIDRYALPNEEKITTAFHVRPSIADILQRGRVQPNFGHAGGGEEAYFKNGTSDGSLIGIKPYGQ